MRLPLRFTFKEAKVVCAKGDQSTKNFLDKCIAVGILTRVARGVYEKVPTAAGQSDEAAPSPPAEPDDLSKVDLSEVPV